MRGARLFQKVESRRRSRSGAPREAHTHTPEPLAGFTKMRSSSGSTPNSSIHAASRPFHASNTAWCSCESSPQSVALLNPSVGRCTMANGPGFEEGVQDPNYQLVGQICASHQVDCGHPQRTTTL